MVSSEVDFILQNMQKELEAQVEKVNKTTKERDAHGKRIGQFEAQLSETKVVLSELGNFYTKKWTEISRAFEFFNY